MSTSNRQAYNPTDGSYPIIEASIVRGTLLRIKMLDVLTFLIPLLQFIELRVVGRLFMPDVLLAFILPRLLSDYGQRLRTRLPQVFICLGLLWLMGQVATDIVRATVFSDYVRGWAKIAFTLVNFCALYLLIYGQPRRIFLYSVGLAIGGLIGYFVNPGPFAEGYPWKFGYGVPITWLLVLLAVGIMKRRHIGPYVASGMLLGGAALNIFMGFRSLGGICFLTACYVFLQARWGEWLTNMRSLPRQVFIGVFLVIAGTCVFQLYDYGARSGLLGKSAKELYDLQAFGEYGLFLGGRSEVLVSSRAILDSPFLGHGSWAKDQEYSSLLTEIRRKAGYGTTGEVEEDLIPTHSHLLGAWVEAGLTGAIFWAWVLILPFRVLFSPHSVMDWQTALAIFFGFMLIWDTLFSPYGAGLRFIIPFYTVVMMSYLGKDRFYKRFRGGFLN